MREKEDRIFIECRCGCGKGLRLENLPDGNVYVSFTDYMFHSEQGGILHRIREDICAAKGGPLVSLLVNLEDLEKMRAFLKDARYTVRHFRNAGKISISWDSDFGYVIELRSLQNGWDIIRGKRFRCYEIALGKDDAARLASLLWRFIPAKNENT